MGQSVFLFVVVEWGPLCLMEITRICKLKHSIELEKFFESREKLLLQVECP